MLGHFEVTIRFHPATQSCASDPTAQHLGWSHTCQGFSLAQALAATLKHCDLWAEVKVADLARVLIHLWEEYESDILPEGASPPAVVGLTYDKIINRVKSMALSLDPSGDQIPVGSC